MATLSECRRELSSIISELRDIEWGIRHDFVGIGQDKAADCVDRVADKYDGVLRRLYNVDTNRLADWIMSD